MLKVLESASSSSSSSDEQDSGVCSFLVVPVMESEDRRQQNTEAPVVPELSLLGPSNHGNVSGLPQVVPQGGGVDLAQAMPQNFLTAFTRLQKQVEQTFSQIHSSLTQINQRLEHLASRVDILEQHRGSSSAVQSPTDHEVPQMTADNIPTHSQGSTEWPGFDGGSAESATPTFRMPTGDHATATVDHSPFAPPLSLPPTGNRTHPCFPWLPPLPPSPA